VAVSTTSSSARKRGPQARGQVTRARLMDAAEVLFKQRGYDGTSIGDVAREAGVGVGTVYHHFPDKRAILLELVERWGDRVAGHRRSELDFATFLEEDPRRAIHGWLARTYQRLRARPSIYLVVLALADRDDEVRRRYQRIEQLAIERLTALIEFGQRRGLMRADVDAAAAAFLIHHSLDMAVTQLLVRGYAADAAPRAGATAALREGRAQPLPEIVLEQLGEMICRYVLEE
jgi:AcrR family transcriptional regulator